MKERYCKLLTCSISFILLTLLLLLLVVVVVVVVVLVLDQRIQILQYQINVCY